MLMCVAWGAVVFASSRSIFVGWACCQCRLRRWACIPTVCTAAAAAVCGTVVSLWGVGVAWLCSRILPPLLCVRQLWCRCHLVCGGAGRFRHGGQDYSLSIICWLSGCGPELVVRILWQVFGHGVLQVWRATPCCLLPLERPAAVHLVHCRSCGNHGRCGGCCVGVARIQ